MPVSTPDSPAPRTSKWAYRRLLLRISQYLWEKSLQSRARLVSGILATLFAVCIGLLAFSGSWPMFAIWAGWIALSLLVVAWVHTSVVEADLQDFGVRADQELTALRVAAEVLETQMREATAAEKAAIQELKDFRDALKGVLLPLSAKLEEIPLSGSHADASHKTGQFQGLALDLLFLTAGKGRFPNAARATLYGVENGVPKLIDFRGRSESPRESFEGDSLLKIEELMRRGDARVFYTNDNDNSVTPSRGSTYQVVVASSVGRKPPKHGMLTIDSSARDHLSDDDLAVVQSVGSMLAASHRIVGIIQELERAKSENAKLAAGMARARAAAARRTTGE
ncbi:hypothetical protein [Arthrobacter sp. HS15c]|uniref:hypothetical protein n=1 Tax=Arthrobacter sp. HS15c TaxID=3230279 RepID=UPI0034676278